MVFASLEFLTLFLPAFLPSTTSPERHATSRCSSSVALLLVWSTKSCCHHRVTALPGCLHRYRARARERRRPRVALASRPRRACLVQVLERGGASWASCYGRGGGARSPGARGAADALAFTGLHAISTGDVRRGVVSAQTGGASPIHGIFRPHRRPHRAQPRDHGSRARTLRGAVRGGRAALDLRLMRVLLADPLARWGRWSRDAEPPSPTRGRLRGVHAAALLDFAGYQRQASGSA